MSKNFYGATLLEDDYAFEEKDDERTWFPNRNLTMDCENEPSAEEKKYNLYLAEEAEKYFAKEKESAKKEAARKIIAKKPRTKMNDVLFKSNKGIKKKPSTSAEPWWNNY